ncbi:MAG: DUF1232 domain-containing protein [Acidimicrobiales bacterium]|nr:DUF1232 domain-containing protein [Acidimicrobiales bacterium]
MAPSTTTPDEVAAMAAPAATRRKRRGLSAPEWVAFILAAVYVVSPVDVIPEVLLGPLGLTDDVVAVALLAKLGWSALRPAEPRQEK